MSNWEPTEGLRVADTLVKILETEAPAAGSLITPMFRFRMMELISSTIDGAIMGRSVGESLRVPDGTTFANGTLKNGVIELHRDDEAVHSKIDPEEAVEFVTGLPPRAAEKPTKAPKGKPAKAGGKKRGRPSKAELAARAAQ